MCYHDIKISTDEAQDFWDTRYKFNRVVSMTLGIFQLHSSYELLMRNAEQQTGAILGLGLGMFFFSLIGFVILLLTFKSGVNKTIYVGVICVYTSLCLQVWYSEDMLLQLNQERLSDENGCQIPLIKHKDVFVFNLLSSTIKIFVMGVHLINDF